MDVRDAEARVLEVRPHPLPYFTLHLAVPAGYAEVEPGQFVMLETTRSLEPYVRRAFSVADVTRIGSDEARIELLAKVVGRGTGAMAGLRPGDLRAVLGPLGRPFGLPRPGAGPVALVAGGVGSAPLLLLARKLVGAGARFDFFYGGRSAGDLPRAEEFERLTGEGGGRFVPATEDGSRGFAGRVTSALDAAIAQGTGYEQLYACGPMPMLAAVARLSDERGVPGQAALETEMGCGFGACLGCAVPARAGGYRLCCKDGPVFRLDEVRW